MSYKLLIISALLALVGCSKDPAVEPYAYNDTQQITLQIDSFSDKVIGETRASTTGSIKIHRGYIFFYNSSTKEYICKTIEDVDLKQSGSKVTIKVDSPLSIKDKIIAIFNYDETTIPDDLSSVTYENLESKFPISAQYLEAIEAEMNGTSSTTLGVPMYLNDFTDSDRATREIYRSVARMELFIKDDLKIEHDSHTHVIGANALDFVLVNEASAAAVGFGDIDWSEAYSLTEYTDTATDTQNKAYLLPYPYATKSIGGKELDANTFDKERFAIILRHGDKDISTGLPIDESRYYKLNLLDKATSTYFDVNPNHSYRIVIKAVNSRGYGTIKEAYDMPPSNIEYEIYDDKGGFTYSNGQYAISMDEILSYDEVLVYGTNETTLEFNNIRYVLPEDGQMDGAQFDTNEVYFEVKDDAGGLIIDTKSDFTFNNFRSELTDKGKSIKLTLKGEGECTIALRVKLGNLEMGRNDIKIKKEATNGSGDGAFDAHPNHFEIYNGTFVKNSWQSDDVDFGARASSATCDTKDGGVVIYMGENATPTGYKTMDGFVSGKHSKDSYPVFSPKRRKGYYAYKDSQGETRKVMIQLDQLAPFYLGHFGSAASDATSLYHYDGVICEKIEEIETVDGSGNHISNIGGVSIWSEAKETYYQGEIWSDFLGLGARYRNLVEGLDITKDIVENTANVGKAKPTAALYCYMKNDIDGDGVIEDNEPIRWYLPAQNQVLAMWISMNIFQHTEDPYRLSLGVRNFYWTSSEADDMDTEWASEWYFPTDFSTDAWAFNMLEGQSLYNPKIPSPANDISSMNHIRCVRGLD